MMNRYVLTGIATIALGQAPAEAASEEETSSDLSNLSLEELQAELERRKSE